MCHADTQGKVLIAMYKEHISYVATYVVEKRQ